ncbi:acyl-CoA dehydrogenase [Pseudomonas sp. 7P_10.2_Bac1]|uniref:acyl-CoA dehydrogenase family protein n=1 Tax=Pseudomonas sp. 7P_10.2_Bac1 TaxID=2971614 RepID=UPI0021C7E2D2|nr:acyl-CoA dehydrogenase [Pseudomonas sp. 7P_10.2_Bac1]MCU1729740.1 acyl-CoA dehydrogenase [Pseudomonas sp. 7P_10.2_Bac1]
MDLQRFFENAAPPLHTAQDLGACLQKMVDNGLDQLPMPGRGHTLERWQHLAYVAGQNLGLCKLYEGHTDALATLNELSAAPAPQGSTWGLWAAEPPNARVQVHQEDGQTLLNGRKAWCSGAAVVSHGLITAWNEQGKVQLVAVDLQQPGIRVENSGWEAVGMSATASVDITFEHARATCIGQPGDYLQRPGFWQGAIGIAACWYGAANRLGEYLQQHCQQRAEPHALAHLGAIDAALFSARCILAEAARRVDSAPTADVQRLARQARAHIEICAEQVIGHVGHALGAGPYCKNPHFARLNADLPVYLRQSHAERDLEALGALVAAQVQTAESP